VQHTSLVEIQSVVANIVVLNLRRRVRDGHKGDHEVGGGARVHNKKPTIHTHAKKPTARLYMLHLAKGTVRRNRLESVWGRWRLTRG